MWGPVWIYVVYYVLLESSHSTFSEFNFRTLYCFDLSNLLSCNLLIVIFFKKINIKQIWQTMIRLIYYTIKW